MATVDSPDTPGVSAQVDPTYLALRTSLMPRDWNLAEPHIGNHQKGSWRTGNCTVIASGGAIFSLLWSNPQFNFLLQRLSVSAAIQTAFGAAQELAVDLVRVINFSAADTGGTLLTPFLKSLIKDTNMGPSQVPSARIATTAALTAGTGTAEVNVIAQDSLPIGNVAGNAAKVELFNMLPGEQTPQVFHANEGFRVRLPVTMGAAGVVVFTINMEWGEFPNVY